MATAALVFAEVRALMNDVGNTLWTDAVQLPFLQRAHRELQNELWRFASPVVRKRTAQITVTAGALDLSTDLPADIVEPISMVEKGTAEAVSLYKPMTEVNVIPDLAQVATLIYWAWVEEKVVFLGATANRHVRLYYRKSIAVPTAAGDPLGFINAEQYLPHRVAAMAAMSVGNQTLFEHYTNEARQSLGKVIRTNKGKIPPGAPPPEERSKP